MHNYDEIQIKLFNCAWLQKCGDKEEKFDKFSFIWAKDLSDVKKNIESVKWENVILEESNEFRYFLSENYPVAYDKWNEELEKIKERYMPEILSNIQRVINDRNFPESILIDIRYVLNFIYLGDFYSDLYHSELLDNILNIYLSGHLPCGYKGRYGKGSIIIY